MKYCVSGRQPMSALKTADEIRVNYQDYDRILDFIEVLNDKTIILDMYSVRSAAEVDWSRLQVYDKSFNFIVCLYNLKDGIYEKCKELNLKFYWGFAINSYYKLRSIVKMNPAYVTLDAPLTFDLPIVKKITGNIPIRICPNLAYSDGLIRDEGICGTWIRPEDLHFYESYIDVIEFNSKELRREMELMRIYKEQKKWNDNLKFIIDNLNIDIDNTLFPPEFGELRVKCGQRCMMNGICHYCPSAVRLIQTVRKNSDKLVKKGNI